MPSNIPITHYSEKTIGREHRGQSCFADVNVASKTSYMKFNRKYRGDFTRKGGNIYDYRVIIHTLNKFYIDHTLESGNRTLLPSGMGELVISRIPTKPLLKELSSGEVILRRRVDRGATKKAGKRVYYTNDHSEGSTFKWRWLTCTDSCTIQFKKLWKLIMCRNRSGDDPFTKLRDTILAGNYEKFNHIPTHMELVKKGQAMTILSKGRL